METRSPIRQRNGIIAEVDATANKPIVRDETYYRETGDCVILVGTVLFKIHRFLLERDMSAFSNMFSLPEVNVNSQINSDENPLVLYDDVDDFRALCWILYALPTEYSQQHTLRTANIQNLVSLYLISHKYHFEAHEKFARDLLLKHCSTFEEQPSNKYNYFNECPESRLEAILRVAVLTETTPDGYFSSMFQNIWKNRLEHTKGSILFALKAGEVLGLRRFVGQLYYLELTGMKPVLLQGSDAFAHPVTDLEPHQKLALYQGSWSLRLYWSKIQQTCQEGEFLCADSDDESDHDCSTVWEEGWDGVGDDESHSKPFDPMKELEMVETKIESANNADSYAPCANSIISAMIEHLREGFADHFLGPPRTLIPDVESSM